MSFESFVIGSMAMFFVTFNLVSWLRESDDEDIIYEYYESSSLEEEYTKVKVVPVNYKGERIK